MNGYWVPCNLILNADNGYGIDAHAAVSEDDAVVRLELPRGFLRACSAEQLGRQLRSLADVDLPRQNAMGTISAEYFLTARP